MRILRIVIVLSALLLVACGDSKKEETRREYADTSKPQRTADEQFAVDARAAANKLQLQLKSELAAAMREGGPANAIDVCSRRAQAIAEEVAQETGMEIQRVSDRNRNPENKAPYWQAVILDRFRQSPDLADTVFVAQGRPVWMKPIRIGSPLCLKCHGAEEDLAPEVREKLAALYPNDEATGFAEGDLRGAFVVR